MIIIEIDFCNFVIAQHFPSIIKLVVFSDSVTVVENARLLTSISCV